MVATFCRRAVLGVIWLLAGVAGLAFILNYENTAGRTGVTPQFWPGGTGVTRDVRRDTLLLFAHPQCPCTRASLEELNRILAQCRGRAAVHVFFFKPSGFSDAWVRTDLWRTASALPGVQVQEDADGALAKKFGAETSGFVALYNPQGQLLFRGGITGGRGHIGDNVGERSLVACLTGREYASVRTPVYGCALSDKVCSAAGATP